MNCPHALRADIQSPPKFMAHLPIDKRGYPIPFFVDYIDGEPEFRAMDRRKFMACINQRLCWTCGKPLFAEEVFAIGPMCSVNKISSEPPSHRECAVYAATNCPFLTKPQMHRREDERINVAQSKASAAGVMIERNPGVTLLWYTRRHELISVRGRAGAGDGFLFKLAKPFRLEWYRQGRPATRAEIMDAIDSGLPLLRETAAKHDGPEGVMLLEMQITSALRLVPR